VELICTTADDINIDDASCDKITATQTLEYIEDIDTSLKEIKRISKTNSKFVNVSILWDYFRFYGPEKKN
jgi:ubiquinone/menaquinone biosynthesis C-methylase UbiE